MQKITATIWLLSLLALAACSPAPAATPDAEVAVRHVVEEFGTRLQNVALLAPDAAEQMTAHYAGLVTPELLAEWQANPERAPGRQTSSPWPERIEIVSVQAINSNSYRIHADVVEATSSTADAHRQPVEIIVSNVDGQWLLSAYTVADSN